MFKKRAYMYIFQTMNFIEVQLFQEAKKIVLTMQLPAFWLIMFAISKQNTQRNSIAD